MVITQSTLAAELLQLGEVGGFNVLMQLFDKGNLNIFS